MAERVSRLHHPNLVEVYEGGHVACYPYTVMELVTGASLARSPSGNDVPVTTTATLIRTLAFAMEMAHRHGVVHGNLKPSIILLATDGTPKIGGFIVSRWSPLPGSEVLEHDPDGTVSAAEVMGTPRYMAPEQLSGRVAEVGPTTDVYALGLILYERLAGWLPFRAATIWQLFAQILHEPVQPLRELLPDIPQDLDTICLRCLAKRPSHRYTSAGALADDLDRFLTGKALAPFAPRPPAPASDPAKNASPRRGIWARLKGWLAAPR
jgi:serine/threonine-protein kinase